MLLERAYKYLERITPLKHDCGLLCDKSCCKGEGEIWLLPGEENLFCGREGFEIKSLDGEYNLKCTVSCDDNRSIRPFCCRIFPCFPIVNKHGGKLSVRLITDPRGTYFCPLARGEMRCTRDFERAVRKAVRLLCLEEKYFSFFLAQGEMLEEILRLREKLIRE